VIRSAWRITPDRESRLFGRREVVAHEEPFRDQLILDVRNAFVDDRERLVDRAPVRSLPGEGFLETLIDERLLRCRSPQVDAERGGRPA
jgi:hypothetical protein